MAVNKYFNNFDYKPHQDLHQDLVTESIQIYGYDFYYLPRRGGNVSDVLNSDDMSYFNKYYVLEMYIRNIEGFSGDGNFLSKFGLEIRDRITLTVSRARYKEEIGDIESISRPREGDLLYFPMTRRLFEIMFVDDKSEFYPLGQLPMFDLQCEVFEYNNERFSTGIPDIDNIETELSIDRNLYTDPVTQIIDPTFNEEDHDAEFDNYDIEEEFEPLTNNFSIIDPFKR